MARIPEDLTRLAAVLLAVAAFAAPRAACAQTEGLHDRPTLALDPGVHTASIRDAELDAAGETVVTGSHDKTVRLWSAADGAPLGTIRLPAGPGNVGKVYAVAISPDGGTIAVGGWTRWTPDERQDQIYLFAPDGEMLHRIAGLPNVVNDLAFSPDGRRLAAVLGGSNGLRIHDRDRGWAEIARDEAYGDGSYGVAFARDGRLATTSDDGRLRLYDDEGARVATAESGGAEPFGLAFSPDGAQLAVGYADSTAVRIFDGRDLSPLPAPDVSGIDSGNLSKIAWAEDGTLLAAGRYDVDGDIPVVAWADGGAGPRRTLPAGLDTVASLRPLPSGDVLVAAADPWLGRIAPDGAPRWTRPPVQMDARGQMSNLGVSRDGLVVDFGFEFWRERRARFDVSALALTLDPPADGRTAPPVQSGLAVDGWVNTRRPTLDGRPLPLRPYERSRSFAVHPDGRRFVLGTEWRLRAFDAEGEALWPPRAVPGVVWAVNVSGDGRLAVAAYGDGTIRWHRMEDGEELLALFPFADGSGRWVAWTPDGHHAGPPEADDVLGWHVNRGWDQAPEFRKVSAVEGYYAPEVVRTVLRTLDVDRAVERTRRAVAEPRAESEPKIEAKLHVLAIGVSRYREHEHLKLDYADDDATELVAALMGQAGLYADVAVQGPLVDDMATRRGILTALGNLERRMRPDVEDVAVIHFSGHGEKVYGRYHLLPHDVDASSEGAIEATGIAIDEIVTRVRRIGRKGKVLVLLDACRSGAVIEDGRSTLPPNIEDVKAALVGAGPGVVVLSSSTGRQISRENAAWGNGAFTEAVLEALRGEGDDGDGWISVGELQSYVVRRVQELTEFEQTPTITVPGERSYEARLFRVP